MNPGIQLLSLLDEVADSETMLDPADWMHRVTLDILSTAAFGQNLDSLNHPNSPVVSLYHELLVIMQNPILNFLPWIDAIPGISPGFQSRLTQFQQFLIQFMNQKKQAQQESSQGRDLLDFMLDANQENIFSQSELIGNLSIFFLAVSGLQTSFFDFRTIFLSSGTEFKAGFDRDTTLLRIAWRLPYTI
jgi:cytochrome P450 family 4 subfamily V